MRLPDAGPAGGVALVREWIADLATISCAPESLDALLIPPGQPQETFGLLLAALRLNLPAVCVSPASASLAASLAALGFTPLNGQPSETVVDAARREKRALVENFSLANAVRAVGAAGGGPESFVHLAALAREAGVVGFSQMVRVLAPETPAVPSEWLREHGVAGLFAHLGDALHDVPTVAGRLKKELPDAPSPSGESSRIVFVRGRSSGAEAMVRVDAGVTEASGQCRVFESEGDGVRAVVAGRIRESDLLVVRGCGARGGPGLVRLDGLAEALREAGLAVPVLTDGVAPEEAPGTWASLFTPEAAAGGVMGRLRDGDGLRLDFAEGRIRTAVEAKDLMAREAFAARARAVTGYAARYAVSALPALEGAGFGYCGEPAVSL